MHYYPLHPCGRIRINIASHYNAFDSSMGCVCVCVVALCGNALLSSHTHALMHDAAGDCGSRDGYPFPTDRSVRDVATARPLAP